MDIITPITRIKDVPNALVDEDDYEFLSRFKWYVTKKKGTENYYYHTRIGGKWCKMTHLIFPEYEQIDHKDHNTCDNRKHNLRLCDNKKNSANRIKCAGKTSRFKGVCWHKRDKRWSAAIKVDGKIIHLGNFKNEEEAALVYNGAAKANFGSFANINIV